MSTTITPTSHERAEWSRMAAAAKQSGLYDTNRRFRQAAESLQMTHARFDKLQADYRRWLTVNMFPDDAEA